MTCRGADMRSHGHAAHGPVHAMKEEHMTDGSGFRMDRQERDYMQHLFGKHISHGQVRYLRCAHLDVYERLRRGATFTDAVSGRQFFDCFSSAGCFNVGRGNEIIRDALKCALDGHDMGSHLLLSEHKVRFATKLSSLCPGDLNKVVLCASGADACAGAIKLAKGATGRNDVITMNKAYHGHEGYSLSANGKDYYKELFLPLMPGFHIVDFNDLEAVRRLASKDIAAIVLEPIQGEGGIHVATTEYIRGLRKICDEHGIMLIFDEVQTGFGRTGTLWAMEHYGVTPDIMFTAKSISGGSTPMGRWSTGRSSRSSATWRPIPCFTPPTGAGLTSAASSPRRCSIISWRTGSGRMLQRRGNASRKASRGSGARTKTASKRSGASVS